MTEFLAAGIEARSRSEQDVRTLLQGQFDAIVLTPSWDSRCLSITDAPLRSRRPSGSAHYSPTAVHSACATSTTRWSSVGSAKGSRASPRYTGPSENLRDIWRGIFDPLTDLMRERNRPLRVLVDLSTCPRYYAAGLLSSGLQRGVFGDATFFYAEASYSEAENAPRVVEPFTSGRWSPVPVPDRMGRLQSHQAPLLSRLGGLRRAKTFTAVNRADPDRVALLFVPASASPREALRRTERPALG